ncbi:MAG: acyltransferase [Gammaproteobacteria bacterium RIFCSPHIGHO2_12_FULL_41_15]|nr:MAG: acyltransferase [Gammaproteobacteria bacterium RIFCSPHIGHO2_12_FULL_41_15]
MKIAAIQMTSTPHLTDNLKQAEALLSEAAKKGATLALLPEMFAIMGETTHDKLAVKEKMGQGPIQDFLQQQAKKHHLWIIAGTLPMACPNDHKVRAACLVYDAEGRFVARYDKIHLYDADISTTEQYRESDTTEAGSKTVVIDTPVGKIGLAICYDVRFPELFRALVNKGAEIFSLPSAFTVKTGQAHWELLARARAVENFCFVIGACQGGTHSSTRKTYGHSVIINPWGDVIALQANNNPGVIYAEIDREQIYSLRKSIPVLQHQRAFKVITDE